jgi:hypothetical protein
MPLSAKERIAFKIAARARKFVLEDCPIEGYDYLYACISEAKESDPELYVLLQKESEKFDSRMESLLAPDAER